MAYRNPKQRPVDSSRFAMIPRPEVPRSTFRRDMSHKTAFDAGLLIPVFVDEVLPGDTHQVKMTAFARLATPIYPLMDNMWLESFFFFVPNRLLWTNWVRMMGEEITPGASTAFSVPIIDAATIPANGFPVGSIYDYFGLPVEGQITAGQGTNMPAPVALPFRAYVRCYYDWFRDQNMITAGTGVNTNSVTDGPDAYSAYSLLRRGKRHDYFTSCLPWPQKGTAVSLPLGTSAPVGVAVSATAIGAFAANLGTGPRLLNNVGANNIQATASAGGTPLYADLTTATAATINQLREAFQIQRLLERNARGGTRYTELLRAHFGVISPDARLQRAEYLGGGSTPVMINPVPQQSATTGSNALGDLSGVGTALASGHGFSQSFTEHGWILGLVNVRADLTYQQGIERFWQRRTRYEYYWPVFAQLGEQLVYRHEIFWKSSGDSGVAFGYQERWAEYRYGRSKITGILRSGVTGTLDAWHLAQNFATAPGLNQTFIEDTPPVARVIAVPTEPHFICDMFFDVKSTRPLPTYSVPGLIDHF